MGRKIAKKGGKDWKKSNGKLRHKEDGEKNNQKGR